MAQLIVRNLEEAVKRKLKLKRRAARHGHSMEQEIREILRNAVKMGAPAQGICRSRRVVWVSAWRSQFRELRGYPVQPVKFDDD